MSTGNDYDQSSDPQRKAEDSILESFQASPPEFPFSSVQQKVDSTRQTLQDLEDATEQLARTIGLPAPRGQTQRKALILAAQWVLDSPDLTGINVKAPEWDSHEVELNELLSAGIALSIIHMEFSQFLAPEAWAIEADRIRAISSIRALAPHACYRAIIATLRVFFPKSAWPRLPMNYPVN